MMRLINGIIYKSSNFEFSYAKPTIHCSIPILNHPDSSNFHRGKIVHRFRFGDERVEKNIDFDKTLCRQSWHHAKGTRISDRFIWKETPIFTRTFLSINGNCQDSILTYR